MKANSLDVLRKWIGGTKTQTVQTDKEKSNEHSPEEWVPLKLFWGSEYVPGFRGMDIEISIRQPSSLSNRWKIRKNCVLSSLAAL